MQRISGLPTLAACIVALAAFAASAARAEQPVALVEDVTGPAPGIEPMDYLSSGHIVRLGKDSVLVLGYLKSCLRETITGGEVTVGENQSAVSGGKVVRRKVECDGGRMRLTREQAGASGVVAFRVPGGPLPVPQVTLYGTAPAFDMPAGRLTVERLDATADAIRLEVTEESLSRGRIYDFAAHHRTLAPGGLYRASLGDRSVVFRIDPTAKPGRIALISRMLSL